MGISISSPLSSRFVSAAAAAVVVVVVETNLVSDKTAFYHHAATARCPTIGKEAAAQGGR